MAVQFCPSAHMLYHRYSRLARKEEARNIAKAIFFILSTIAILVFLAFFGLQILTKIAVFLGNLKSSSTQVEQEDKIPPMPPVIESLPEATVSAKLELKGFAEAESKVEIYLGGNSIGDVIVSTDGSFTFDDLILHRGINEIYAKATDKAGNTSQASRKFSVSLDDTPPALTIIQPQNNASFLWPQEQVNIVGETEPQAQVFINDHLAIVNQDGNFQYTYHLNEGDNTLTIVAKDAAGNKTETALTLHYSL
jgi:bacillopeptidase F